MLVVISLVTLVPVLYVIIGSFDTSGIGEPYRFGYTGWNDIFSNPKTLESVGYSFLLSIRIPIAIAMAFGIAWLLIRIQIPGRRFIEHALWFGFFLPPIPMTMGWILLLDSNYGLVNNLLQQLPFIDGAVFSIYSITGIIWVHLALSTVPVMVILLAPALRQIDAVLEEAASMSGAGPLITLRRVTIPLIGPAIMTAFVAGLIRSLEVFEIEQILGTPVNISVYATRIYDLINWDPPLFPQAMALSAFFLVLLFTISVFYQLYLRRLPSRPTLSGKGLRTQPRVRSRWDYVASAIILLYIAVSIFLPLAILVLGSFTKLFGFFFLDSPWTTEHWKEVFTDPNFVGATVNSIVLGLSAGIIGTAIFSLIAWVLVRTEIWGRNIISVLTWLPWAIPGLVLGVTLLSLMLNVPVLSALYGTIVPLVLAMIIKELPIGVQLLKSSLSQVSGDLEEAAQMAGSRFGTTFRRITLPLIAPMLVAVFLLIFMATMRDISTVVLLAAPGTRTLSLLMFDLATSSRFESAAVIGVIIALISLIVTSIAFRIGLKLGVEH